MAGGPLSSSSWQHTTLLLSFLLTQLVLSSCVLLHQLFLWTARGRRETLMTCAALKLPRTKGSWLTRSRAFQKLTKWAFSVCDPDQTGSINKTELYAGFLLVHLNLAKYAGPAACYPPPRATVDRLFDASDDDNSGGIDQEEFNQIMMIACSQITSRIAAYYAILILCVPYLVSCILHTMDYIGVDDTITKIDSLWDVHAPRILQWLVDQVPDSTWAGIPEQVVSLLLFFFVIPTLFNIIDEKSRSMAEQTVVHKSSDENEAGEKKDL